MIRVWPSLFFGQYHVLQPVADKQINALAATNRMGYPVRQVSQAAWVVQDNLIKRFLTAAATALNCAMVRVKSFTCSINTPSSATFPASHTTKNRHYHAAGAFAAPCCRLSPKMRRAVQRETEASGSWKLPIPAAPPPQMDSPEAGLLQQATKKP